MKQLCQHNVKKKLIRGLEYFGLLPCFVKFLNINTEEFCSINLCFFIAVLDVDAFERLLGPCMNIMKRNIEDYETQLVKIFGSKQNMTDVR